jgi:LacI family transcriptional regulator
VGSTALRQHRRTTLSDVAARATVSVTTASYVLNGRWEEMRISEEAVDRVRAAAADLKYRPNRSARNLRTASTATIGVISDQVASGSFANQMLTGVAAEARRHKHLVVIGESEGDPATEALLVEELLDRQVDGIVYATFMHSAITVPRPLRDERVVLLNCSDVDDRLPGVVPDEVAGARTAATTLLEAGHREGIFLVGGDALPRGVAGDLRRRGVVAALAEAGTALAGTVDCAWTVVPAHAAVGDLLDHGVRPRALVCLNDRIAMGAYQALAEHGLRVPEDVAVVSFDGSDLAGWLRPSLTSVQIPYRALGSAAVATLLGGTHHGQRIPMPLLRGGSTGPAGSTPRVSTSRGPA